MILDSSRTDINLLRLVNSQERETDIYILQYCRVVEVVTLSVWEYPQAWTGIWPRLYIFWACVCDDDISDVRDSCKLYNVYWECWVDQPSSLTLYQGLSFKRFPNSHAWFSISTTVKPAQLTDYLSLHQSISSISPHPWSVLNHSHNIHTSNLSIRSGLH